MQPNHSSDHADGYCGTSYAGRLLGLSVGTIQLLVEKDELKAWKTKGGHRRISISSIHEYQNKNKIPANYNWPHDNTKILRMMLIDDDTDTREMLHEYLNQSKTPVDCTATSSGLRTLIDICSINPDILIADLNMSGMDGFELLRTISRYPQFKRMTILALSGLCSAEIEAKGGLPVGTIFITKPIRLDWFNGFLTAIQTARSVPLQAQVRRRGTK